MITIGPYRSHKYEFNSSSFYGLTRRALAELAFELAERNNISHQFSRVNRRAGEDWVKDFLSRHRNVSPRHATPISTARVTGFNRASVEHFFENLNRILSENPMSGAQIFNADETGTTIVPVSYSAFCSP